MQIAPQNPTGTDPDKTMVVDVQEGSRYTFGYGGGFEVLSIAGSGNNPNGTSIVASPRGILEVARSNMFGRAQTLSFRARASTLQYRALLAYTADQFLGYKSLSASLTGFADKTLDVDTFTSIRYEGAFQITEKLSPSSSIQYRYFFRRVLASNLNGKVSPEEIPLYSQPTLVSGFGITYARDRRDNPTEAKHGTFNSVDLSVSSKALGSSASFVRGFFQNSSFYSFGRDFVFARSTRFGIEHVFGGSQEVDVPLPERFFAGGGQSLRGFSLNQAGPRDPVTGFPIGGLGLLMFNQELRFPMKLPIIGNKLGGTLFYDGGNVFSDVSHINLDWKSKSDTELNYFSHTIGFGVRYPTPIGPVRVDIGYLLNPAQYPATVCEAPTAPLPNPCPPPYQVDADIHAAARRILVQHRGGVLMRRAFMRGGIVIAVAIAALCSPPVPASLATVGARALAAPTQESRNIDGVAARIEDDVITESEIRELGAFEQLVDGKPKSRAELIRLLADQWLVHTEAVTARYAQPSTADVESCSSRIRKAVLFAGGVSETVRRSRTQPGCVAAPDRTAAVSFAVHRLPLPPRRADHRPAGGELLQQRICAATEDAESDSPAPR